MTTSPAPAPLSARLRSLLEADPVRHSGTAYDVCDQAADLIDTLTARVAELEADRDSWEQQAAHRLDDALAAEARATQAEALLSELARLTGAESHAAAVSVVATMLHGADATAYGGVVRAYADERTARTQAEAVLAAARTKFEKAANAAWRVRQKLESALSAAEAREAAVREALTTVRERLNSPNWYFSNQERDEQNTDIIDAALSSGAQQAQGEPLVFTYTNYRGETGTRRAIPIRVYHGATEWHPEPQWLMEAHDVDKDAVRVFAMQDMGQAQGGDIAWELAELREAAGRVVRETEQDAAGHFIVPEDAIGDLANLLPDEDGDDDGDDEITPAFRTWLQHLEEDVIQGEYGFEPGEFSVFPEYWRQMFTDGLTPQQAYRRALDAFSAGRDEEDRQRKDNWERIQVADAEALAKARASGLLPTETREEGNG
ncbi:hypothetical protein ABAZ39_07375 [Azospirillum argentinense]|uniref:Uncharacterized protein n=1 Tax=Azospirillum argentinense TaxID=2970906 RepID=A0A060DGG4_9PROT|nr:hypothetical protein [Azospirillum argentinense]AIB11820.1 hypothetical protein ABAZ39_07375 [Azospirillum argentinense]EZQ08700.1 hypothetical protein ABAZ39_08790 [Azospirillum argentinense]